MPAESSQPSSRVHAPASFATKTQALAVRLTKFHELMKDEFGAGYAQVLLDDLVLGVLGDKTGRKLISEGVDPRLIWQAICEVQGVPRERWHGKPATTRK